MATERIDIIVSERGAKSVSRDIEGIGRAARSAQGSLQLLQRALGFLVTGAVARQLATLSDSFQNLQNRVNLFAKNQGEANKTVADLTGLALKTRTSLDAVATVYQRLALQSDRLGLSQERTIRITELLSKTIAIGGSNAAEASGALIQFAQAISGDFKAAGQEINSVLEQLPGLAEALARGLTQPGGKTLVAADIKRLAAEGALSADLVLRALESQGARIDAQFSKIAPTISSAFTNLTTGLTVFVGKLSETTEAGKGISKFVLDLANSLVTMANDTERLNTFVNVLKTTFELLIAVKVVPFVLGYARAMDIAVLSTLKFTRASAAGAFAGIAGFFRTATSGAGGVRLAFANVGASILSAGKVLLRFPLKNTFTLAAAAILLAVGALIKFKDEEIKIDGTTVQLRDVVVGAWNTITDSIGGAVSKLTEFLGLKGSLKNFGEFIKSQIGAALGGTAIGEAAKRAAADRQKKEAEAAAAASGAAGGAAGAPLPSPAGVGTELTNFIAEQNKLLQELRGELDPVAEATDKYNQQVETLKDLTQRQIITQAESNRLQGLAKEAFKQTLIGGLDPLVDAETEYERQLGSVDAALKARLISQEEANALLKVAQQDLQDTLLTNDRFLDSLKGGEAGIAAFHTALRDFASGVRTPFEQLQSGFNAVFGALQSSIDQFVETGKFSFKDFASSVLQDLQKIALKALLVQAITAGAGAAGFNVQALFGAAGGGGGGGVAAAIGGATKRQGGGPVAADQPFKVGESGTELFVPARRGRIVSNSELSGLGGRQQVVQNFTINTPDADSFRRSESQILKGASRNLRRAEIRR